LELSIVVSFDVEPLLNQYGVQTAAFNDESLLNSSSKVSLHVPPTPRGVGALDAAAAFAWFTTGAVVVVVAGAAVVEVVVDVEGLVREVDVRPVLPA
jgi:hypothetical protein